MSRTQPIYRGTVEYLSGTITADAEVTDADSIAVSFDRITWHTAEWVGAAGTTRTWRLLVGDTVDIPGGSSMSVFTKVTDNPEIPVDLAGVVKIV